MQGEFNATDVGGTRRVSLGREDKGDLQIVALERQDSLSSSSTDYEEIDLNTSPPAVLNEDKRTFADSEDDNDSEFDQDDSDGEEKYVSDSHKEEEDMLEAAFGYDEEDKDTREDSLEGYKDSDDDVKDSENFDNDEVNSDAEDHISDDVDNTGTNDVLSDDESFQNENDQYDEENVEHESDEDIFENTETNSTNGVEVPDDEVLDSDNEVNILNDISITIANESLLANSSQEILAASEQENDLRIFHESNGEQINVAKILSPQRIIIRQSESEDEIDCKVKGEMKKSKEQQATTNETEKPIPATAETSQSVLSSDKVDSSSSKVILSSAKVDLSSEGKQDIGVQKVKKASDLNVECLRSEVKRNSKPSLLEKPKAKSKLISTSNKEIKQKKLPMENTGNKAKEPGNENQKIQRADKNISGKSDGNKNKAPVDSKTERLEFNAKNEDKDEMDFDQLSIEDEDSDFVEEEENLPTVKSKVGLNKIPSEGSRTKRSVSRENNRKRRRSYSPERSRFSSRSYQSHSLSHDRLRDQRLRGRSRERFHRRSQSPLHKDRAYRRNYNRHERSRSRDRALKRITSDVGKNRENRRYRSRSRSGSRQKSGRTIEKDSKTDGNMQIAKNSVRVSEKGRHKTKKEEDPKVSIKSQKKEIMAQKNGDREKTAKLTESKSLKTLLPATDSDKKGSKPTAVKAAEVKVKQSKGV